jgi:hypothetical protein
MRNADGDSTGKSGDVGDPVIVRGPQQRSRGFQPSRTRQERPQVPEAWWPLDIPTYDGNPSVGHPSVVFVPGGWNGFRYWMAFTPFPDDERENPSVVVSQDGIRWWVPDGAANPVVSADEVRCAGYRYNSDPELVLTLDGRMLLYYRPFSGGGNEAIFCKYSRDGVAWSTGRMVLSNRATRYPAGLLSPTVEVGADGVLVMWTVNGLNLGRRVIEIRTSLDGLHWSLPQRCLVPRGVDPWHIDVVAAGGRYHMLVSDRTRLFYWISDDGRTWTGSRHKAVARSGTVHDARGHYRSTFVPTRLPSPQWDVWITGQNGAGRNLFSDVWRIGLLRNLDLAAGAPEERSLDLGLECRWRWQHLRGRSLERALIGTDRLRRIVRRLMAGVSTLPKGGVGET